jgi:4-azaleucine resistance transporter AzlC
MEGGPATARPCFTARGMWRGCINIAPVAIYVVPFGVAFGVAATAKGLPPEVGIFISMAMMAGASQFAALDLWHAPLPLGAMALTVLAVNARHLLFGAALAPWLLQIPLAQRLAATAILSDANFAQAMQARDRGELDAGVLCGAGLLLWLIWTISTAAGALGGSLLGNLSQFGLDAVMVAYLAATVAAQWRSRDDALLWAAIAAAIVSVAGSHFLPAGWHIIAGALAGGAAGAWRHG